MSQKLQYPIELWASKKGIYTGILIIGILTLFGYAELLGLIAIHEMVDMNEMLIKLVFTIVVVAGTVAIPYMTYQLINPKPTLTITQQGFTFATGLTRDAIAWENITSINYEINKTSEGDWHYLHWITKTGKKEKRILAGFDGTTPKAAFDFIETSFNEYKDVNSP